MAKKRMELKLDKVTGKSGDGDNKYERETNKDEDMEVLLRYSDFFSIYENKGDANEEPSEGMKQEEIRIPEQIDNEAVDNVKSEDGASTECLEKKESKPSTSRVRSLHVCTFEGCGKTFNRPSRLENHKRTHTGERPYVCDVDGCLRTYTRQQHLKRHIANTHQEKPNQETVQCSECEGIFSSNGALQKHHFRFHVLSKYKCEECGQKFKKQQHLRTHSYLHTGIKPYKCGFPGCDVRCKNRSRLKRHCVTHLNSRYACSMEGCKEVFDHYTDLQSHMSCTHHKACDICGRPFRQLRRLLIHRKTHDDVREAFFCPYQRCDKYYYYERNLTVHIKSKHENCNIYECGICKRRLSSKQKLVLHMTTHNPNYCRNYSPKNPRKPRKDKGVSRTDYARLLSGYYSDDEMDVDDGAVCDGKDSDVTESLRNVRLSEKRKVSKHTANTSDSPNISNDSEMSAMDIDSHANDSKKT